MLVKDNSVSVTSLRVSGKEFFCRFLEKIPEGSAILSVAHTIIAHNSAFLKMLGYSEAELGHLRLQDILFAEDKEKICSQIEQLLDRQGDIFKSEARFLKKEGVLKWANLTITPFYRSIDDSFLCLMLVNDITKQKEEQGKLLKQIQELTRANVDLKHFASVISHDLQEPLYLITSYIRLLAKRVKGSLGWDADEYINYILGGVSQMQDFMRQLQLYGSMEKSPPLSQPVDCMEILETVKGNLNAKFKETGSLISCGRLPKLMGQRSHFLQLFQNLISNALKSSSSANALHIHVGVRHCENGLLFYVRDTGDGMDTNIYKLVSRSISQYSNQEQLPCNTIGLAICKKIVERYGGRIWIESKKGEGTAIYFTLETEETTSPSALEAGKI